VPIHAHVLDGLNEHADGPFTIERASERLRLLDVAGEGTLVDIRDESREAIVAEMICKTGKGRRHPEELVEDDNARPGRLPISQITRARTTSASETSDLPHAADDTGRLGTAQTGKPTSVNQLLETTRLLHLALSTEKGPHLTPHAFTWWGGRIWIVTFRDAFKDRAMRKRSGVSVLLGDGSRFMSVDAEAKIIDPLDPLRLLDALPETLLAPTAAASWALRNARNVRGYLQDVLEGETPALIAPHRRLLVALRPLDTTEVERPAAGKDVVTVPARVALDTDLGSIVVPGLWDAQHARAFIAPVELPDVMDIAIEIEGPFEDRPSLNRGALLRGSAIVEETGSTFVLKVAPERETRWSGATSASTDVGMNGRKRAP
jgi:hypothetical protein